eukprot:150322-Chlamydomonas_euryale.AAC.5
MHTSSPTHLQADLCRSRTAAYQHGTTRCTHGAHAFNPCTLFHPRTCRLACAGAVLLNTAAASELLLGRARECDQGPLRLARYWLLQGGQAGVWRAGHTFGGLPHDPLESLRRLLA